MAIATAICADGLPCDVMQVENADKCVNIDHNALDIRTVDIAMDGGTITAATVTVMTAAMTTFDQVAHDLKELAEVQEEAAEDQNAANPYSLL